MARREPRLEAGIEASVDGHAVEIGWLSRKLNGEGYRSWPDRMYVGPRRARFYIEYKRPGHEPTPLQDLMHAILRLAGETVYVVERTAQGKQIVDLETKRAGGVRVLAKFKREVKALKERIAHAMQEAR